MHFCKHIRSADNAKEALNDARLAVAPDELLDASDHDLDCEDAPGTSATGIRNNELRLDATAMILQREELQDTNACKQASPHDSLLLQSVLGRLLILWGIGWAHVGNHPLFFVAR